MNLAIRHLRARRLRVGFPAKRVTREERDKERMRSPADRRREAEGSLLQARAARKDHSTGRKNPKKERHRPANNNSFVFTTAAPEKFRSRLFFESMQRCLCQTPLQQFGDLHGV